MTANKIAEQIISERDVYKAAEDLIAGKMAIGAWQDPPAPKDELAILGIFDGWPHLVRYECWDVWVGTVPDGTSYPPDGAACGWVLVENIMVTVSLDEPEKWARIIHPQDTKNPEEPFALG